MTKKQEMVASAVMVVLTIAMYVFFLYGTFYTDDYSTIAQYHNELRDEK